MGGSKIQRKPETYCHKLSLAAEKATRCQHSLFFLQDLRKPRNIECLARALICELV